MGLGKGLITVLGSTHVVDKLSFSMIPSILTLIGLNFGVIFDFLGPQWAIFEVGVGFKNIFGSTHVVEQLLLSIVPTILT